MNFIVRRGRVIHELIPNGVSARCGAGYDEVTARVTDEPISCKTCLKKANFPSVSLEDMHGMTIKRIIVEGMFDGTLAQFKDNFFSNADAPSIKAWADDNGYKVDVLVEKEDGDTHGMSIREVRAKQPTKKERKRMYEELSYEQMMLKHTPHICFGIFGMPGFWRRP
jgi:hypothetical protein